MSAFGLEQKFLRASEVQKKCRRRANTGFYLSDSNSKWALNIRDGFFLAVGRLRFLHRKIKKNIEATAKGRGAYLVSHDFLSPRSSALIIRIHNVPYGTTKSGLKKSTGQGQT